MDYLIVYIPAAQNCNEGEIELVQKKRRKLFAGDRTISFWSNQLWEV